MTRRKNSGDIGEIVDSIYFHNIDPDGRLLYLGSNDGEGIDEKQSESLLKGIHLLSRLSPGTPLKLIINSPGGAVVEGLAIYDALRNCDCPVFINVYGKCYSMAGYILQAATEGGRRMSINSHLMLHEGTREMEKTHPRIVKAWEAFEDKLDTLLFDLYLKRIREVHSNFPAKRLEKMLAFDTILSAEETVNLGLADGIIGLGGT